MKNICKRWLDIDLEKAGSAFLWGPRKTGKSYWLEHRFPQATLINLLKTDLLAEYASRPALLRERFQDATTPIAIDEIQLLPAPGG